MESVWAQGGYQRESPYRGLTQIAVALAHLKKGNVPGARSVFEKARLILTAPWDAPIPVGQLLRDTYECIQEGGAARKWPRLGT